MSIKINNTRNVKERCDKYRLRLLMLSGFILILSGISLAQQQTVTVTLQSSSLTYNYNVGTEWSTQTSVNGSFLNSDNPVQLVVKKHEIISLYASVSEADNYLDFGSRTERINVDSIPKGGATFLTIPVIVEENRSQKTGTKMSEGYIARWEFNFKLERFF